MDEEFRQGILDALRGKRDPNAPKLVLSDWLIPTKPMERQSGHGTRGTRATVKRPSLRALASQDERSQEEHATRVNELATTIPFAYVNEGILPTECVDIQDFFRVLAVMRMAANGHQKRLLSRGI